MKNDKTTKRVAVKW